MADEISRIYRLLVDATQAVTQLTQINSQLKNFGQTVQRVGNMAKGAFAALGAGFTVGAFTSQIQGAIKTMDDFGKAAAVMGVSTEAFSKLNYAAESSGASTQLLTQSFNKLTAAMQDVAGGRSSKAGETLKALGISVKTASGQLRSSDAVFRDLSDAFSKLPDSAEKSQLAISLFGEQGTKMIPLLNAGTEGLEAMGAEAEKLGLVFSDDLAKSAAMFNDNMGKLKKAMDGTFARIAQGLLPALNELTGTMVENAVSGEEFITVGYRMGQTLSVLGNIFKSFFNLVQNGVVAVTSIWKSLGTLIAAIVSGNFKDLPATVDQIWQDAANNIKANNAEIVESWDASVNTISKTYAERMAEIKSTADNTKPVVKIPVVVDPESVTKAKKDAEKAAADIRKGIDKELAAIDELIATPFESLEKRLARLDELFAKGEIKTHEKYVKAVNAEYEKFGETIEATNETVQDNAKETKTFMQEIANGVIGWSQETSSAIVEMAKTGEASFSDLAESIISSLAKMALQANVVLPIFRGLQSALGLPTENAKGNIFSHGNVVPFARGGIVTGPTLFPMANGTGLMGEAGPEAIIPLSRGADGKLGLQSKGVTVNIINNTNSQVSVSQSEDSNGDVRLDVLIESAVDSAMARGRFDKSLNNMYGLKRRGQ